LSIKKLFIAFHAPLNINGSSTGKLLVKSLLTASLLLLTAVADAQQSDRLDGMRFVPDVAEQFKALADQRADPLGFRIGSTPNPSMCRHYQGLARVDAPDGTPYFLITKSGNDPDGVPGCFTGESGPGTLIVVRMGSRGKNGERLRSNRLRKGVHVNDTPPPPEDTALPFYTFVHGGLVFRDGGGTPPRAYSHPGGMQLVGHVLAVAIEHPVDPDLGDYEVAPDPTLIMFLDVTNPEDPRFLSQFVLRHPDGEPFQKAGVVAITPLPDGLYLMAVTGGDGSAVHFFRSSISDLTSPNLSWHFVDHSTPEVDDDPQQTLQFLREGDINGQLYLAAVRGSGKPAELGGGSDHDKLDLYYVNCLTPDCAPGQPVYQPLRLRGRVLVTFPNTGGDRLANGAAASGYYVSPTGELILYATEHDNDGPSDGRDGTVKMGEWAHRDQVREGSPTYLPTAVVGGPYEVDEGSSISLNGSAQPPIAKAWIQLYHDTDFGSFSVMVDQPDYDLDDFDDFATLEFLLRPLDVPLTHNNKARSWRWFAPQNCSIAVIDRQADGIAARLLAGTGSVENEPDLSQNFPNTYEKADAVRFLGDCGYTTPFVLRWDLDRDGTFETTGSPVTFNALTVDGPSVVNVAAHAQSVAGGPTGQTTTKVIVRNVAPQLTQLHVTNEAGSELNVEVPFVLINTPIRLGASFTDPGVLDRQTATIAWGDGSVEAQAVFASFDEAFGDRTGGLSQTHHYTIAGSFPIALSVRDDDGGLGNDSTVVRVVTPEQAVQEIISMLDSVIASTTDKQVRNELEKARKALAGDPYGNNGALEKIRDGNRQAAIAFLNQAIDALRKAQAGGADVATEIALLEQVVAALASA